MKTSTMAAQVRAWADERSGKVDVEAESYARKLSELHERIKTSDNPSDSLLLDFGYTFAMWQQACARTGVSIAAKNAAAWPCPFCGSPMANGYIWVSGARGGLYWCEGNTVKRSFLFKDIDKTLLRSMAMFDSGAKTAFHCDSCNALLTKFEDREPFVIRR